MESEFVTAEMADEDISKLIVWSKARLPPISSLWTKIGLHDPRAGDLERSVSHPVALVFCCRVKWEHPGDTDTMLQRVVSATVMTTDFAML